jgi:polysaccharide biosynthesis/export protein
MRQALRLASLAAIVAMGVGSASAQTPPTQPRSAPAQMAATQPQEKDYIIGPEDILEIQVWGNRDLNQTVFVRPDGRTSLPLVGEIGVAGKSVQQLQDHLTNVYETTVKGAVVTVIVREIKSRPVYFVGGFARPGVMQLLTRDLTLLQAISVIGGVLPNADSEKGFVLRGDKRIPIDFNRLLQRGDLSQNPKLEPGDSIVVPLADSVYVSGEVKAPGAVKYTGDLTILKALTQVGGPTPLASIGRVDILRGTAEKKERIRVDVDKMMRSPDENPDLRLQPNDIIFVPQRLF